MENEIKKLSWYCYSKLLNFALDLLSALLYYFVLIPNVIGCICGGHTIGVNRDVYIA